MSRREELREIALEVANLLKTEYKVKRIFIIGSLVKGYVHPKSDIDIVVEGLAPEFYIKALTRIYDLLPLGVEINLIPFEDAFESLREKAIKEGELLYA